jgi:ankyrin repeat protein
LTGVIDINAKNSEGMSALHLACKVLEAPDQYSRAEDLTPNVELLIKYKADINILNNDNQTPLMFALAQQNLDAARVLVRTNNFSGHHSTMKFIPLLTGPQRCQIGRQGQKWK